MQMLVPSIREGGLLDLLLMSKGPGEDREGLW